MKDLEVGKQGWDGWSKGAMDLMMESLVEVTSDQKWSGSPFFLDNF